VGKASNELLRQRYEEHHISKHYSISSKNEIGKPNKNIGVQQFHAENYDQQLNRL